MSTILTSWLAERSEEELLAAKAEIERHIQWLRVELAQITEALNRLAAGSDSPRDEETTNV